MNTTRLRSVFRSVVLACATALGLGAWADYPTSDIISLNISNDSNYTMSGEGETETLAGTLPDNAWQNTANSDRDGVKQSGDARNGYMEGVTAWDGENQTITTLNDVIFTWAVQGTGVANYGYGTMSSRSPAFQCAWLARFSTAATDAAIVVQNIPYEKYDVIVYLSGNDTANDMRVVCVNGVPYKGDADNGAVAVADKSAGWGKRQDALEVGKNALRLKGLTGGDLSLNMKDATCYGISAVQIIRDMDARGTNVLSVRKVISVNLQSKYTDGFKSASYGLERVPSEAWTDDGLRGASSSGATVSADVKEWNGETQRTAVLSGVTITEKAGNSYNCAGRNGFGNYIPFYNLLNGYLDDNDNEVRVSNVPYKSYDVIVYTATDTAGAKFGPVSVNGIPYKYDLGSMSTIKASTSTAQSSTVWGFSHGSVPGYGANALRISGQTSPELVISGANKNTTTYRGGIAGFQIVDTTEYVNVADGGELVIDRAVAAVPVKQVACDGSLTVVGTESYTVTRADLEKIDFSQVTGTVTLGANTSYDLGTDRTMQGTPFDFAEGYTVDATETHQEFGNGRVSIAVSDGVANVRLTRVDGTRETLAVADGVATFGNGAVAIDGAATMFDATFTNTTALAYKTVGSAGVGTDTTATYDKSADDPAAGMYIKHHPWISGAGREFNSLGDFTAVVVGQMSPTAKTQFIHIGSSNNSYQGLFIATTANKDEVIITTNTGGAIDEVNAVRATVPNAASARHAYVIIKTGQTFTVWVDGVRRGAFTVPEGFVLGAANDCGLQVGSDFGGVIKGSTATDKYAAVAVNDSETGVVNVIRIFDYAISDAQAEAVVKAYPYVSAGGLYTRTVTGEAEFSAADAWDKTGSDETFAVPEGAEVEGVHYNPSATLTADGDAAVTVNASVTVDKFTVGGTGTMTFKKADGCAVKVADAAIINSPVVVEYGALDLAGTPVQLGSAGALTFNCTAIDVAAIYAVTRFQLTGLVARDDEKFTVVKPVAATGRAVETAYNANGYYELVVTPDHTAGSEVYYTGGYWADIEGNTISVVNSENNATCVFAGDTVVVGALFDGAEAWVADSLPANVTNIRIAKDFAFHSGVAGTILGSATLSVDEDATLTFSKGNSENGVTLGAVVVNGPGTVVFDAISVADAVSGTAPISIAAGKAVTVAATGSITQAVKLNAGATLTVMDGATVAQPTTDVEGAYVKETAIDGGKVYAVATYAAEADGTSYKTVKEALDMAYMALPASMGKVITVKDSEWEDDGAYASYFTWDAEARTYTVKQFAARVLTAYYETLAAALENVPATGTVLLLQDITLTGAKDAVVFPAKAVTLDLYGHTIGRFANSYYVLDIPNGAEVTITDASADGTGRVMGTPVASGNTKNPASLIRVKGKLTLESGALVSDYCCVKVDEDPGVGAFVMNGGNLEVIANDQGYTGLTFTIMNWGVATVNGGTHKGNVQSLSYSGNAASKASTLTINGGSFDPANIYLLPYDKTYAPTVKIVSTIDNLTVVNAGLEALNWEIKALDDETVDDKTYKVYTLAQGVEEIDGSGTVEVVADSEEAALEKVAVVPATAEAKAAVAADVYAAYFKKTAKLNEATGRYTVTAELDPAVVFGAEEAATDEQAVLDAVLDAEAEKATLSAKPGLYYSLEGATAVDFQSGAQEGDRVLATGATVSVEKPSVTGPTAFFRIKVSATPAE